MKKIHLVLTGILTFALLHPCRMRSHLADIPRGTLRIFAQLSTVSPRTSRGG